MEPDTRVDIHPKCAYWANIGECEQNPQWMVPNCPISCDNCVYGETEDSG